MSIRTYTAVWPHSGHHWNACQHTHTHTRHVTWSHARLKISRVHQCHILLFFNLHPSHLSLRLVLRGLNIKKPFTMLLNSSSAFFHSCQLFHSPSLFQTFLVLFSSCFRIVLPFSFGTCFNLSSSLLNMFSMFLYVFSLSFSLSQVVHCADCVCICNPLQQDRMDTNGTKPLWHTQGSDCHTRLSPLTHPSVSPKVCQWDAIFTFHCFMWLGILLLIHLGCY